MSNVEQDYRGELPPDFHGEAIVRALLRGRTPMLQDAWETEDMVRTLHHGDRPPPDKTKPPLEEAREALYKGPNGELGVPGTNLSSCLKGAGRFVKLDAKRFVSTAESTLLPSFLTVDDVFLPFVADSLTENDPKTKAPWTIDIRRGNNKTGAKKVPTCIIRPRFNTWALRPTLRVDLGQEGITMVMVRKLVVTAGRRVGLCSFNQPHNGPFGQFVVEAWEVKPAEEEEAAAA